MDHCWLQHNIMYYTLKGQWHSAQPVNCFICQFADTRGCTNTHTHSHLLNCLHIPAAFQGLLVGLRHRGKEQEMRYTIDN